MHSRALLNLFTLSFLAGCGGEDAATSSGGLDGGGSPEAGSPEASLGPFTLESSAFAEGGTIPASHRCSGTPSPPLAWSGAPSGTQSFAVVMRDLDFGNGFLHWIIYDIPASTAELPSGVPVGYEPGTPPGAKQASVLGQGYFGPCSTSSVNTYQFTLYALDVAALPDVDQASTGPVVVTSIEAHAIADVALSGESGP